MVSMHETSPYIEFKKVDTDKQLVYGEVYIPMVPDSQGDFATAEVIEKMAHNFIGRGNVQNIDVNHNLENEGAYVVESFIAREGDPDFIEKSWVVGVQIIDESIWELVKDGEINGFSMFGTGKRKDSVLEIDIPNDGVIKGATESAGVDEDDSHRHTYTVKFDDEGNFLGGSTSPGGTDKHVHNISKGTITDETVKHVHRYAFMDALTKDATT